MYLSQESNLTDILNLVKNTKGNKFTIPVVENNLNQ